MLKIATGTISEQKIGYLKEVLEEFGIEAEIIPAEVESGISFQPMTSKETKQGSTNRAKDALLKNPQADCGIGIEVGYELNEEKKFEMFSWSTIISKDNKQFSSKSHSLILPKFHQDVLNKGLYLGEYVREYFKTGTDKLTQVIAEDIRGRKSFIISSLKTVLVYYLKIKEF